MSRIAKASAIPVGTQFSPDLVDLKSFLGALLANSGDKKAIESAVWQTGVRLKPKQSTTPRTRSLPVEAAVQYGLLTEKTYEVTDLARDLAMLEPPSLYDTFGRHILLRCGGLRVVDGIRQMEVENIPITGDSLAEYLTAQGFNVSVHNTAINSLRMWLAWAGVFIGKSKGANAWRIADGSIKRLLKLDEGDVGELASLEEHHLAFIDALCAIGPRAEYKASEVRALAIVRNPRARFSRGSLPKDVLEPLKDLGLITYSAKGTQAGKSSTLNLTSKFDFETLQVFVSDTVTTLDAAISSYFKKRPEDVYADLDSQVNTTKGRALEALAIRLMRLLGLRFVAWNNRARNTGWAEVDAVVAGVFGAAPTRWQIQCKNTPGSRRVELEDVAKEVGLVPITHATHILFLANNGFTREAEKYADQVMYDSGITLFLLGKEEFKQLKSDDSSLGRILREKALSAVRKAPNGAIFAWK